VPASSRETTTVLSWSSPTTLSTAPAAEKVAGTTGRELSQRPTAAGIHRARERFVARAPPDSRAVLVTPRATPTAAPRWTVQHVTHGPRRSEGGGAGTACSGDRCRLVGRTDGDVAGGLATRVRMPAKGLYWLLRRLLARSSAEDEWRLSLISAGGVRAGAPL